MGEITKLATCASDDDPMQSYVRITDRNHRGFVEFQFSIGDPTVYLDMTLPPDAFAAFCRERGVRMLTAAEASAVDAAEARWRYGDHREGRNQNEGA